MEDTSFSLKKENKKGYVWIGLYKPNTQYVIVMSKMFFLYKFYWNGKTFLKQHLVFVFQTNPWVYFVKTHECFFIHPISFSGLFHAKGNMIMAAQEEFWYAVRHNGYTLWRSQKGEQENLKGHSWMGGKL